MMYWILIITAIYFAIPVAVLDWTKQDGDDFTTRDYIAVVLLWGPMMVWSIVYLFWVWIKSKFRRGA